MEAIDLWLRAVAQEAVDNLRLSAVISVENEEQELLVNIRELGSRRRFKAIFKNGTYDGYILLSREQGRWRARRRPPQKFSAGSWDEIVDNRIRYVDVEGFDPSKYRVSWKNDARPTWVVGETPTPLTGRAVEAQPVDSGPKLLLWIIERGTGAFLERLQVNGPLNANPRGFQSRAVRYDGWKVLRGRGGQPYPHLRTIYEDGEVTTFRVTDALAAPIPDAVFDVGNAGKNNLETP